MGCIASASALGWVYIRSHGHYTLNHKELELDVPSSILWSIPTPNKIIKRASPKTH